MKAISMFLKAVSVAALLADVYGVLALVAGQIEAQNHSYEEPVSRALCPATSASLPSGLR